MPSLHPAPAPALTSRTWTWVVILGLTGQIAWMVENMYLNVFVYNTITDEPNVLAALVAASAIAGTVATLLAGAWSDRVGRRREFIAAGYVLWGLTTAAFGLVGIETAQAWFPAFNAVTVAVVAIIALDCVMSVFGSTGNDAAYQAWVTDSTDDTNRGKVDAVIGTFPMIAMLIVFGALDPLTQAGKWETFFLIVGALTTLIGIAAWFFMREAPRHELTTATVPADEQTNSYLASVLHGLRPATIRANPRLYWALTAWCVLSTACQVFLPYLIIYVQRYLDIDGYAIVLAATLIGAAALSIPLGRRLDAYGTDRAILAATGVFVVGLLAMFVARGMIPVIAAGIVLMTGFILSTAAASATSRNHTPADRAGQVQGLRMIFAVMIPMVIGPFLGAAVINSAAETYVDLGVIKQVPTPWIFPVAAVVAALVVIPVRLLRRIDEKAVDTASNGTEKENAQ